MRKNAYWESTDSRNESFAFMKTHQEVKSQKDFLSGIILFCDTVYKLRPSWLLYFVLFVVSLCRSQCFGVKYKNLISIYTIRDYIPHIHTENWTLKKIMFRETAILHRCHDKSCTSFTFALVKNFSFHLHCSLTSFFPFVTSLFKLMTQNDRLLHTCSSFSTALTVFSDYHIFSFVVL